MADLQPEFLDPDYCSSWVEVALDVFVVVKAVVLLYYSSQGILWFWRSNFTAITVIFILIVSMGLVSPLSNRDAKFVPRWCLRWRIASRIGVCGTDSSKTRSLSGKSSPA